MARSQPDQLIASVREVSIGAHDHGVNSLFDKARKGGIDFAFVFRIEHQELEAQGARCHLRISGLRLRSGVRRINEKADHSGTRQQVARQFQPFRLKRVDQKAYSRDVTAGVIKTGNETKIDRVGTGREYDWDSSGRSFGGERSRRRERNDDGHWIGH